MDADNVVNIEGFDIFVFSNGQEYTPPRKYYLRPDELYRWDATLNYLARAQYGSLHSIIELYTIDGVKVNGPTEIYAGRAYVAVVPPESFINSGYENYLVKASRSWEKRQSRKLSNITDETTVESGTKHTEVLNSNKSPHTDADATMYKATVRRQTLKNGANSKQAVKQKPLTGQVSRQEHSSILRKSNSISQPPTSQPVSVKTAPIKRKQTAHKYSKIPKRIDNKLVTPEKHKTMGQAPVTNTVPKTRKEVVNTNLATGNAPSIKTNSNNIHQKYQIKEPSILSAYTEDTEIFVISDLYKNMESDVISTYVEVTSETRTDKIVEMKEESIGTVGPSLIMIKAGLSFQNPNSIDEINGTTNLTTDATAETSTQKTEVTKGIFSQYRNSINATEWSNFTYESNILPNNKPPDELPQNISLGEPLNDSQFRAVAHKGDVVNLNLNIEIKNPEVAVQAKSNEDTCKSRSLTGINKQDIEYNETVTQNKSVLSVLNDYLPRLCCHDDQNLAYIQCACIDNSFRPDPKTLCPEVRTCYVLLPVLTRAGKECCKCDNNENMKTLTKPAQTCSNSQQPKVNIVSSVKDSTIFIQTDQHGSCTNAVSATSQTEFTVDCISKCQVQLCSECGGNKMNVSQTTTLLSEKKTETVSFQENKTPCRAVCDMGAQTDWCSTMLEARLNNDGHYTFHLPSIQKIKQYNYL